MLILLSKSEECHDNELLVKARGLLQFKQALPKKVPGGFHKQEMSFFVLIPARAIPTPSITIMESLHHLYGYLISIMHLLILSVPFFGYIKLQCSPC